MENYKQIMDDLAQRFGIVIDWTSDNIMPAIEQLCDEIIQYSIYKAWFWIVALCIIGLVFIMCGIKLWKFCNDYENKYYNGEPFEVFLIYLVTAIATGIIILIAVPYFAIHLIKLYAAPSIYLLEYFSDLLG